MTLEETERESGGTHQHVTECPFCGYEIGEPGDLTGSKLRYHLPCDGVDDE